MSKTKDDRGGKGKRARHRAVVGFTRDQLGALEEVCGTVVDPSGTRVGALLGIQSLALAMRRCQDAYDSRYGVPSTATAAVPPPQAPDLDRMKARLLEVDSGYLRLSYTAGEAHDRMDTATAEYGTLRDEFTRAHAERQELITALDRLDPEWRRNMIPEMRDNASAVRQSMGLHRPVEETRAAVQGLIARKKAATAKAGA